MAKIEGKVEDKSGNFGHANANMLLAADLGHIYIADGKVTSEGMNWLKDAVKRWGPKIIDHLRPELAEAARTIDFDKD